MSVSTAAEKIPRVSESKRQLLEQLIDQGAANLEDGPQGTECSAEFADVFAEDSKANLAGQA